MNKPRYEATSNSVYLPIADCVGRYCLSENSIRKIAREAGAMVKIGRRARINKEALDAYLAKQSKD